MIGTRKPPIIALVGTDHPSCRRISLTLHPENERARQLYTSVGFQPTGMQQYDEPVYALALR
jgi:RimJ/RimL family protein N-acetyltransferase